MSTEAAPPQLLLQTKLYQPQPVDNLILRPRLSAHLNQCFPRKLTLITAHAGYGKTTVATQWLSQLPASAQATPVAWLSLDEYDDDPLLFLRYLVAAIQTAYPHFGEPILAALRGAQVPAWLQLINMFVNDLAHLAQPLFLVLDDSHVITNTEIHKLLNRLLDYMPPAMHLVILSRTEPPLALARLRVNREMQELHTADLAFSTQEIAEFLMQAVDRDLPPDLLQALYTNCEGWIAGLQLMVLSLPHHAQAHQPLDTTLLLQHLRGNNLYCTDYLFEEVLAVQPPTVQTFLLQTALLDRFCAPLCQAILGPEWLKQVQDDDELPVQIATSQNPTHMLLSWLRRANLFLVPLDNEGIWYRYHHLFREMLVQMLQRQMDTAQIATRHWRASTWLATEGVTEPAIRHALAAADAPLAAQLIEQQRYQLLSQHDFYTLDRWLSWLPPELIAQRPALLIAQGWRNYFFLARETYYRLAKEAEVQLARTDLLLGKTTKQLLAGEANLLKALGLPFYAHTDEVWEYIEAAAAQIPEGQPFVYPYLVLVKINALNDLGRTAEARSYMEAVLRTLPRASSVAALLSLWPYLLHFNNGNLRQCAQGLEQIWRAKAPAEHSSFVRSVIHSALGSIYYEWQHLETAAAHLTVLANEQGVSITSVKRGKIVLSALYQTQGQTDAAMQALAQLDELNATAAQDEYFRNEVQSFRAQLLLRQGAVAQARQAFLTVQPEPFYVLDNVTELPQLTEAQLLITEGGADNCARAAELLRTLKATTGPVHQRSRRIKVLALEALLHKAMGHLQAALTVLEEALRLAKPDGFIRSFADLGPAMAELLQQLHRQQIEADYVAQILAACSPSTATPERSPSRYSTPSQSRNNATELVEPLSDREYEVLVLLTDRLSNKEIAQHLAISPFTVKNHLSTIYQKLGVSGRRHAVAKAEQIGLLN